MAENISFVESVHLYLYSREFDYKQFLKLLV
jgi:hypothetical protein